MDLIFFGDPINPVRVMQHRKNRIVALIWIADEDFFEPDLADWRPLRLPTTMFETVSDPGDQLYPKQIDYCS